MGVSTGIVIIAVAVASSLQLISAAPVARLMGCGQPERVISIDKQRYCCLHFNLDCVDDGKQGNNENMREIVKEMGYESTAENVVSKQKKQKIKTEGVKGVVKLLKVRTIGEGCGSSWVRCATGLECKLGFCVRQRNNRHLKKLIEMGKKVEQVERTEELGDGDDDDEDPLPAKEDDVTIRGQSVEVGVGDEVRTATIVEGDSEGRVLMSDPTAAPMQNLDNNKTEVSKIDKAATGIEEDEVTANVADYLASSGKKLSDKEWHAVRELITGTLDERAQREDEVDEVEAAAAGAIDKNSIKGSDDLKQTNFVVSSGMSTEDAKPTVPRKVVSGATTHTENRHQCVSPTESK